MMEVLTQPNEMIHSGSAASTAGTGGAAAWRRGLATRAGGELSAPGKDGDAAGLGALPLGGLAPSAVRRTDSAETGPCRGRR